MRVGSTLLLIDGQCYQSYNWTRFRPLGALDRAIQSLEEYECDEISIIRPVRSNDSIEQLEKDLKTIRTINTMTPLSFGGGIRTLNTLQLLRDLPIERLVFSSAFFSHNQSLLSEAAALFGRQAIQCFLPTTTEACYHCEKAHTTNLNQLNFDFISQYANEIIIHDTQHEGEHDTFNFDLINTLPFEPDRLVVSGGIGLKSIAKAKKLGLASVLIDNKVLHNEFSISRYKHDRRL